jgi:two-component system, chemotaxis family, sensor kinase CheA
MTGHAQLDSLFREEASEHLAELESALLLLEEDPSNAELIGQAFRSLHTIKGSGAMAGFDSISSFAHELETVFAEVRDGHIKASKPLVEMALESMDLIRRLLVGEDESLAKDRARLVEGLRQYNPNMRVETPRSVEPPVKPSPVALGSEKIFRVLFKPNTDILRNGTNPLGLLEELASLGRSRVIASTRNLPNLVNLDPEVCHLSWDIILSTTKTQDDIRDVFIFVEDHAVLQIDLLDDGESQDTPSDYKKLGEILLERGAISTEQLRVALAEQKRIGDLLVKNGAVSPEAVKTAIVEQQVVREARAKRGEQPKVEVGASIRVAANKLDALVDLVGELVIAQARLAQMAAGEGNPQLVAIAEDVGRLSSELRDNALNIRMVPIGTTFGRFNRLVHDLAAELGKEIELVTEGADTELDKTVIERLGDPLVHLIRNSCDHGIETPQARAATGKPPAGVVRLMAYHSGPSVFIEIRDDGAGLDATAIRSKAIEQGLITADSNLSEREIYKLIFLPGFSTAKCVSNVSGRGVGMDVVKRSIEALRGSIQIESELGKGTKIRLKLPLTLAIIEGLLVVVGNANYVLPMSLVEECVELSSDDIASAHGNRLATVRGQRVPYLRLRDWFGISGERPPIEQIAITASEGQRVGLVVDSVVGQHQTVIKTLGRMYNDARGLSGATILGDGTLALIVDVQALLRAAVDDLAHE